jgi:nucleotide-binding universal stress UspA family protein
MKILVPTDFSPCAEVAYAVAAQMARDRGAELHLLHGMASELVFDAARPEGAALAALAAEAQDLADRQLAAAAALPVFDGVRPHTVLGQGALVEMIRAYVVEHQVELMVMGSHGASGTHEMFIGSNTQKVVRQVPCAVLVVKTPPRTMAFRNVVFASSFEDEAWPVFHELLEFVQPYDAHVHLLHIVRPGFFREDLAVLREAMDEFAARCPRGHSSRHLFHADSLEGGIHTFLGAVHADLLCVAHYGREPLRRLFQYSLTEALVNHLDIPVLCLHGKRLD